MIPENTIVDEMTPLQPTSNDQQHRRMAPFWIPFGMAAIVGIALLGFGGGFTTGETNESVLVASTIAAPDIVEVAQAAFYLGVDQKLFDGPPQECADVFGDYFEPTIVVDYRGGPCEFLTGIHTGIPQVCAFFRNMDGRSSVTEPPSTTWFRNGNIVLAKVHGPYVTIPEGKMGVVDEIVAITMSAEGKIARMELFVSHAKDFVC